MKKISTYNEKKKIFFLKKKKGKYIYININTNTNYDLIFLFFKKLDLKTFSKSLLSIVILKT